MMVMVPFAPCWSGLCSFISSVVVCAFAVMLGTNASATTDITTTIVFLMRHVWMIKDSMTKEMKIKNNPPGGLLSIRVLNVEK